jgi:uncharacterized Ntn-hydrolase superfamily protein
MNAQVTLKPNECQALTSQTGQLLVLIGNLLTHESVVSAHISGHTSEELVKLGRKLIDAGKCGCNF